ncbi:hypothetical protein [Achromobacter sp. JUb104]|uniref:hypothetical protein n=1 Tax=Achromobacter sp. JUb104 TaxID=2940590 RepID=UPI00216A616F|nr:hypothetical protein [Achromobacter sp. JUb104]MCS3504987.1 hypothetical protein [Achromobacter sp. JUb104]
MNENSKPNDRPTYEDMQKIFADLGNDPTQQTDLSRLISQYQKLHASQKVLAREYMKLRQAIVDFGSGVVPILEAAVRTNSDTIRADAIAPLVRQLLAESLSPPGKEGDDAS